MDAAEDPGLAGLVRSIEICSPLQSDLLTRATLEGQSGVLRSNCFTEPAGEELAPRESGEDFGGRAAEGAVAGIVARKRRGHERVELVRHPFFPPNPAHTAVDG